LALKIVVILVCKNIDRSSGVGIITVLSGEVNCPYSCYYESVRLPSGHLVNETFGCDVLCNTSFISARRCRQVQTICHTIVFFTTVSL